MPWSTRFLLTFLYFCGVYWIHPLLFQYDGHLKGLIEKLNILHNTVPCFFWNRHLNMVRVKRSVLLQTSELRGQWRTGTLPLK